jgi:4-amino-4-deoxy-L-arabinose transferase-like glycosyltransferase
MQKLFAYPKTVFAILGALFFLPFLGGVHLFDWDEVNFAEISREMVVLKNYLQIHVNFVPFTEKPPGFFWLQAVSMKLFGIGEYAARFPNAVMGIFTLPVLYTVGAKIKGRTFGIFWALAYLGSILPNLYFKSGIIDPIFNFFIFMGIVYLIYFIWKKEGNEEVVLKKSIWFYLIMAGAFTGLGILVKGPVAYLITGLVLGVYWIRSRFKFFISPIQFIIYTLSALMVSAIWYGLEYLANGGTFIEEFIIRQWTIFSTPDAGHGGFPGYHFVVVFFGCFPATAFAIQALLKKDDSDKPSKNFKLWMTILFWVVLILFTIVKSKIVHYSSMVYFPLTYLAAVSLLKIYKGEWTFKALHKVILILSGVLVIAAPLIVMWAGMNPEDARPLFSKDPFAAANMDAEVVWTGMEIIPSLLMLAILVFSILYMSKRQTKKGALVLFGGTAVWVFLTLIFFIKRAEGYSQRANVEFWESKKTEECYLTTFGYKTYTNLFYGEVPMKHSMETKDKQFLYHGDIDKPVYISCKITHKDRLMEEIPELVFLYEKNGFWFYKREVATD